ncbi:hypothetical protein AB0O95_10825 [Rhodoglobus sp. NPDC076762]
MALSAAALASTFFASTLVPTGAFGADESPSAIVSTDSTGSLSLLSDPFLQAPGADFVSVVWNTEFAGVSHSVLVGAGVAALTESEAARAVAGETFSGVVAVSAATTKYSRLAEDSSSRLDIKPTAAEGIVARDVWRHEARVNGLVAGERTAYRVLSSEGSEYVLSGTFSLAPLPQTGDALKILLTSDHQAMANTPANLQKASETIGDIDAVFLAGDLVNHPDRASEWFDDTRGSAFFATLQGNAGRIDNNGIAEYTGGEIVQNAPLYPAVGNHEVQGRIDGATSIGSSFGSPVPLAIAEQEYELVASVVNPSADPAIKAQWIEDNSFSTATYEEMFTLPEDSPGGETYYATSFGDVRLVSLYSTRIWRGGTANPLPEDRASISRYQESTSALADPLAQGYGEHIFESLAVGSDQYEWLQAELASDDFQDARFRVVMLHEGPQGLGDNVMPQFADPVRIEETNPAGEVIGVRYEYPTSGNMLLNDLTPLLEQSGVDLVHNGHSHLWNRFESDNGVNYLETSNTGNSYGAYHELSGRSRPLPPEPWVASNYLSQGNPGGLDPVVPSVAPFTTADGTPMPFVQNNDLAVFTMLDTGENEVVTYAFDVRTPDVAPWIIDRFSLGREAPETEEPGEGTPGEPGEPGEPGGENPGEPAVDLTDAAVSMSSQSVAAGAQLDISGSGFEKGEAVRIELHSSPTLLANVVADSGGSIARAVTIPASTTPGTHRIVLIAASGETTSADLTVTASAADAALAVTGSSSAPLWVAGIGALVVIALGSALLWVRGRNRTAR